MNWTLTSWSLMTIWILFHNFHCLRHVLSKSLVMMLSFFLLSCHCKLIQIFPSPFLTISRLYFWGKSNYASVLELIWYILWGRELNWLLLNSSSSVRMWGVLSLARIFCKLNKYVHLFLVRFVRIPTSILVKGLKFYWIVNETAYISFSGSCVISEACIILVLIHLLVEHC